MTYTPKNYDSLLGTPGFSDTALKNHFTLYGGYVTNTNKVADTLAGMLKEGKTGTPEYNELKRRFGWEFNGMRIHEYYFSSMKNGGTKISESSPLYKKIVEDFGSWEAWEKDYKATATMRGIGWAILYYDPDASRLFNVWINEHDLGHLGGCKIILPIDVFEHAYITDYGLKRADYVEAFMKTVDWNVIEKRFTPTPIKDMS